MSEEEIKKVCQLFYRKYTTQFELAGGEDKYLFFFHTIMETNVKVWIEDGNLRVEEL